MKALDVGSGTGYLTVCMARMVCSLSTLRTSKSLRYLFFWKQVGETGSAHGIEHIGELVDLSIKNVNSDCPDLLKRERVSLRGTDFLTSFGAF